MKKFLLLLIIPFLSLSQQKSVDDYKNWTKKDKEKLKYWWCEDEKGETPFTESECDCMLNQLMGKFSSIEKFEEGIEVGWNENLTDWLNGLFDKCEE